MVCPWMMMMSYGDGTGTGNKIWSCNHQFVSDDEGKELPRFLIILTFCPIFFKLPLNYFRPQYVFENFFHLFQLLLVPVSVPVVAFPHVVAALKPVLASVCIW